MKKSYVMGNGAIALGALAAGVNVAAGYPGTPSSEIIETLSKFNDGSFHVEWSVNEKAAMEVAAGASYAGARTLVTMKQVGLNVASDPLMSLAYVGVKGGMVVVCADDPGPISSQTEQDTRMFGDFARIPVFDPSSPEEAFEMVQDAFDYSEKYGTPVILRPTTRVCHAYASIETEGEIRPKKYDGFVKDTERWVIFPKLSFKNHEKIEKRNVELGRLFSHYRFNTIEGNSSNRKAVVASGISYAYAKEYLQDRKDVRLCKISTPHPFPETMLIDVLKSADRVLVIEELSPYIEHQLQRICGVHNINTEIMGKDTGHGRLAGENTADFVAATIGAFLEDDQHEEMQLDDMPELPVRPPVLCAGCPHRASFYAVKAATKNRKANFCGDIGCYTLGNAKPLDMTDTCLCMGAGITVAQGLHWTDSETVNFSFTGDSTFFASGITGVINAVHNEAEMVLCILDNSTTAMTGHQPHPGLGWNMMGSVVDKIDIRKVLEGIGIKRIDEVNPFELNKAIRVVKDCADAPGVKAVIFKAPCVAIVKPEKSLKINNNCINCKKCIKEIGCPAIITREGQVAIDKGLCTGCGLCTYVCPFDAIGGETCE